MDNRSEFLNNVAQAETSGAGEKEWIIEANF